MRAHDVWSPPEPDPRRVRNARVKVAGAVLLFTLLAALVLVASVR